MLKYTFFVFHKEYKDFLEDLQELGVIHVNNKGVADSEEITSKYAIINQYEKVIQFLERRNTHTSTNKIGLNGKAILNDILQKQKELENLQQRLEDTEKASAKAELWGNFSPDLIKKLESADINLQFYSISKNKLPELEKRDLPIEIITEHSKQILFVLVRSNNSAVEIDAEKLNIPPIPFSELKEQISELQTQINAINSTFDNYAANSVDTLYREKTQTLNSLHFEQVVLNTNTEVENKLMILEGWLPKTKVLMADTHFKKNQILFVSEKPTPNDKIPVLLNNNKFSKLFEPIGSMFSLPDYAELDLTIFFAPFFMLFFGFCLGDAGYGLLFLIGAGIYKLKAKKEIKPYLTLIQILGVATIIFGTISGTFFGINLIETQFSLTDNFRGLFLDPNKMFNLSLILGGFQIIFGMVIRAANQIKQFGFQYALATMGWLIILVGSLVYTALVQTNNIASNTTILYTILISGGFFVLFFSDPQANIFTRLGKGVWDVYSTVTGIFGDLLSYIRLFALGLSSAILGFVINDIGLQILGSSKILGPVFFAIFLLLGHTLNILISSLGSFVHPMRLTFVEFYKSAGFKGGGKAYAPFKK